MMPLLHTSLFTPLQREATIVETIAVSLVRYPVNCHKFVNLYPLQHVKISNTGLNCFNGLIVYTPLSQTALRRVLIMSWRRRGWGKRLSSCQRLGLKFINRFRSQQFLPRPVVPSEGLGGGYLNAVT